MTAPTVPATSAPFPIPPGPAVRLTDGTGNAPAGCQLINPGTNGGTVWISAGPTAAGLLPLGPGASLTWTDPAVLPYASLAAGVTKGETILVTSRSTDYANPAATAAATAVQLAAQGIPSTFLDTDYGFYNCAAGLSVAPINVGQSSSLVVGVTWPQPAPTSAAVLRLRFTDNALPSSPVLGEFYLTNDNAFERGLTTWQVPVLGPTLTVTNMPSSSNAGAQVSIVGSNRAVAGLRQLGDDMGVRTLGAPCPTGNTLTPLYSSNGFPGADNGWSAQTRMNGPVLLQLYVNGGNGFLQPMWADFTAETYSPRFPITQADTILQWSHPSVPVHWYYYPNASQAGNYARLAVLQA